jgi:hypothetical protein
MNDSYRDLICSRVIAAIEGSMAARDIRHELLKGQLKEILIRDLFRPLLPINIGVGSGEVVTASDQHSKQQDIVVYDKRFFPPILFESSYGIFPIESVLYTIEVKSSLTEKGLKESHKAAKEVSNFSYSIGLPGETVDENVKELLKLHNLQPSNRLSKANSALLALGTDLKTNREVERYDRIRGDDEAYLKAICVVTKGYWYRGRKARNNAEEWITWPHRYRYAEVIGFMAGILTTCQSILRRRYYPNVDKYLFPDI